MSKAGYLTSSAIAIGLLASTAIPAYAQQSAGIEQVTVTAERRSENIQDVPASVSVISGEDLAAVGIASTSDLTTVIPGLNFAASTVAAQPTIRGIGSRSASTGDEANVAIYVDGVYQAQPFANLFQLSDISQIQVLKGPQGSLYGRNATGGAIIITTRNPSFTPSGNITASYGTDNYWAGSMYVTGPIVSDKLAGNLSVDVSSQDGYIKNLYLGNELGANKSHNIRGKLLFQPTSNVQIGAVLFDNYTEDNSIVAWHGLGGNTIANKLPNTLNLPLSVRAPQGTYTTSSYFDPVDHMRSTGGQLNSDVDLGWGDFTAVAAYTHNHGNISYDPGATVVPVTPITYLKPWSSTYWVEASLKSHDDGPLKWIFGANYFDDTSKVSDQLAVGTEVNYGIKTKAESVFGEVTYDITDELFLTGGLRYNTEKKTAFYNRITSPAASTGGSKSWNALTPRAVLRYQPNKDLNLYASYSQGFKSGTFAASSAAGAATPVNPEKATAYEVGAKGNLTPDFQYDLAAFYYDYKNLQVTSIVTTPTSTKAQLTNAATARIWGIDANMVYAVTNELLLHSGISLLNTEFTKFPDATVLEPAPYIDGYPVGNVTVTRDVTGKDLLRSPPYTVNVGMNYQTGLAGGTLNGAVDAYFSGKYYGDVNNRVYQPAYTQLNASVSWTSPGNWTLSIVGTNLTDAKILTGIYENADGDLGSYKRPAEVFFKVGYAF